MTSPFDVPVHQRDENAAIAATATLLATLSRVPSALLGQSVRTGSVLPVTRSRRWRTAWLRAGASLAEISERLWKRSTRIAIGEARVTSSIQAIERAAIETRARESIRSLLGDLERKTAANLRRAVYRAAHDWTSDGRRTESLSRLVDQLRPQIGVTVRQGAEISKWRKQVAGSLSEAEVRVESRLRAARARKIRARAIGNLLGGEAINYGRLDAWRRLEEAGAISLARKQWHSRLDGRERDSHRLEGQLPPVPLAQPFPILGVLAPPFDPWCRCWITLVLGR